MSATGWIRWGRFVARRPALVAGVGILVGVLAGVFASQVLEFKTSRIELTGADLPFARRFLDLEEEFGDLNRIVVTVGGADRAEACRYADALAAQIRADPKRFAGVFYRTGPQELGSQTLLLLPTDRLQRADALAAQVLPESAEGGLSALLSGWAKVVETRLARGEAGGDSDALLAAQGERVLADLRSTLSGQEVEHTPFDWIPAWDEAGYVWTEDGETLLLLVAFQEDPTRLDFRMTSVEGLRALVEAAAPAWPTVEVGLTGKPVLEVDEMATYKTDSVRASVIALVGVTLLLVLALRRLSAPLLIGFCLALSVAGTLGLASFWPGHLNLMAVVFVMVVIGLGVDFGIHLLGRYDEARAAGRAPSAALEEALGATGPAITVGALTTGGAFCGAVFTDFKGLREFGVVAGFGVVASLLVTLSVVPALILLNDRRRTAGPRPVSAGHLRWLDRWTSQRPRLVLALVLVLSLAAVFGAARLRYQGNLLLLQDQTLDSVQLELKLLRDQHTTSWFLAYSARDLSELAEVTSRAALLPSVQRVESVLDLYPPGAERRLVPAQRLAGRLEAWVALEARPSQAPALAAANLRLCEALEEALEQALAGGLDDALVVLERLLEEAREVKAALPEGPLPGATLRYEARLTAALRERLRPFGQGSLGPARADRLPAVLRERFVGAHGRYLLRIYPKGNLWDPDELAAFLAEVEAEIPGVTGVPAMLHGASTVMVEAYRKAGWIALAVVTLSLLLLFRSLRPTLVALGSLAVGVLWTAGLMGWLGFDLNPANLIALPLMLGIGIDSAVHVVHRAREGRPGPLIATSLGRALIYSGLTSVASFGTLALGSHPGTASMGTAISVGILCCVSAGLVVAPTLWTLSGPKAADRNEPTEAAAA